MRAAGPTRSRTLKAAKHAQPRARAAASSAEPPVDAVRRFNRFYTQVIGLLDEHLAASAFTLPEARVLYELANAEQTAADMTRRLGMDKAHLSRILARLRSRELIASRASPDHGKQVLLSLARSGRSAFRALDTGSRRQVEALLNPLDEDRRECLIAGMRDIRGVLDPGSAEQPVVLRAVRPGDLGWVTHRQALLYHREYGWDASYEALAAKILGDFATGFDARREDAWIAERDGAVVGSIFLMRSDDARIAKLRLLYVEPDARGSGLGHLLVEACIARARALRYRTLTLWTNDVLVAARQIYLATGFVLVNEAPHHSFGHDLVGQTWNLDLAVA